MPWDWRRFLGIKEGGDAPDSKLTEVVQVKSPQEKRYDELKDRRVRLEELIVTKGFSPLEIQNYIERGGGFVTDDMDVFEYAKLYSELSGKPAIQIILEPSTTIAKILEKTRERLRSFSQQGISDPEPRVELAQLIQNLTYKTSLCIITDDKVGARPTNPEIRAFQDIARSGMQAGKVNLITYCENIKAIPVELSISVSSIRSKR